MEERRNWDGTKLKELEPGEPCGHPGCANHISHPCEGCGRIAAGMSEEPKKEAVLGGARKAPMTPYFNHPKDYGNHKR